MSELIATDSTGEQQFVWIQEKDQSCGPACVYMVERIARQSSRSGGEERVRALTAALPNGYTDGGGTASYSALALVLTQIGLPHKAGLVPNGIAGYVTGNVTYPFIAQIAWPNGTGHFTVVAKRSSEGTLICLDPYYGLIEAPAGNLPAYVATTDYRDGRNMIPLGGTFTGRVVFKNVG